MHAMSANGEHRTYTTYNIYLYIHTAYKWSLSGVWHHWIFCVFIAPGNIVMLLFVFQHIKVKYARDFCIWNFHFDFESSSTWQWFRALKFKFKNVRCTFCTYTVHCLLFKCDAYWILQSKCIIRNAFLSRLLHLCLCGRWSSLMLYVSLRWLAIVVCITRKIQMNFVVFFLHFRSFYRVLHIVILSMNALRLAKNSQITYESAIYFLIWFFGWAKSMHMRLAFLQL